MPVVLEHKSTESYCLFEFVAPLPFTAIKALIDEYLRLYKRLKEINQQILFWEDRQASGNLGKWYNSIRVEILNKKKQSILKKAFNGELVKAA